VDHDAGDTVGGVVLFFAERAVLLVEELVDKLVYLFAEGVGGVLGLLEEEGRGVF